MSVETSRDPFLLGKTAGAIGQGLVIGVLLLYIVLRIMGTQSAQFLFRYEGF
jgi:hypothetical protein